jgi:hypothetical protein
MPLYFNKGSGRRGRYLGWAGFLWAITRDASAINKAGCERGWHYSNNHGIRNLAFVDFTEFTVLTSEEDIDQYLAEDNLLFRDVSRPDDINQGALGNCWLMGSISAVAESEESIKWLFCDQDTCNEQGNYKVRIFDIVTNRWEEVQVSLGGARKNIPYGHSKSGGKWVPVLEKAFADKVGATKLL